MEKPIQRGETHYAESRHKMTSIPATVLNFVTQDEIAAVETALVRKVVQISTMVHAAKDWAFIALCDDGSMWLYHGSWSRIESVPQTYQ